MTGPMPQLPNVQLGNTAQDIGQGTNSFIKGLLDQRQRQQQLAMQQALAGANIQHLGAETGEVQAQTGDIAAQAAGREHLNEPAGLEELGMLQQYYPKVRPEHLTGLSRQDVQTLIGKGLPLMKFMEQSQVVPTPTGGLAVVQPHKEGMPITQLGPTVGKPLTTQERGLAGAGQAAQSAHNDLLQFERQHPQALSEIAKAVALPNFGRLIPFGTGEGVSRVLQSFRLAGASPAAQAYLKRMFDFTGIVGPKRYGLRGMQSEVTLQQLWTDFGLGQFGLSPEGINAAEKNRENAILQMQTSAGPRAWDASQGTFNQPPQTDPLQAFKDKWGTP